MYLIDTNVVSELRKAHKTDRHVRAWANGVPATSLYLSVISVLEIETGILRIERRDRKQGAMLRRWMEEQVLPAFVGRILPIDVTIARRCAGLHVPDSRSDRDALIAATALVHSMVVVTHNVKDFEATGVGMLDPWRA